MDVSYFPGCTLRTKAKHLDQYARACAQKLGVRLCEIPDWQCCGGVYVTANDEIATKLSSSRSSPFALPATMCSSRQTMRCRPMLCFEIQLIDIWHSKRHLHLITGRQRYIIIWNFCGMLSVLIRLSGRWYIRAKDKK